MVPKNISHNILIMVPKNVSWKCLIISKILLDIINVKERCFSVYEMFWKYLSMRCPIYAMTYLCNVLSMQCPIYAMSYLCIVLSMQCPVYAMTYLCNDLSIKCLSMKSAYYLFTILRYDQWNQFAYLIEIWSMEPICLPNGTCTELIVYVIEIWSMEPICLTDWDMINGTNLFT